MSWNYPPSFRVPVIIRNIPTFRFGNHDLNLPFWRLHPGSRGGLTDKMSTKNTSQRLRWKVDPNSIYTLPIQLPISTTCMGNIWGSLWEKPESHVSESLGVFRMNILKLGIRMVLAARARFGSLFFTPFELNFFGGKIAQMWWKGNL